MAVRFEDIPKGSQAISHGSRGAPVESLPSNRFNHCVVPPQPTPSLRDRIMRPSTRDSRSNKNHSLGEHADDHSPCRLAFRWNRVDGPVNLFIQSLVTIALDRHAEPNLVDGPQFLDL